MVTVDSFGGNDAFDVVDVATMIGTDPQQQLDQQAQDAIVDGIRPVAHVLFAPDARPLAEAHLFQPRNGGGIVNIESPRGRAKPARPTT